MSSDKWDGKTERRKMNQEDHDLLIQIHANTKELPTDFKKHTELDDRRFLAVYVAIIIVAASSGVLNVLLGNIKIGG